MRIYCRFQASVLFMNWVGLCGEGFWPWARRDEGAYPQRYVTEEQRSPRPKDSPPQAAQQMPTQFMKSTLKRPKIRGFEPLVERAEILDQEIRRGSFELGTLVVARQDRD